MARDDYPLYVHWYATLDWIMDTCERYPKAVRFSLAARTLGHALDVMEGIVVAIYTRERDEPLRQVNLKLELLRVHFRLAHDRHYLSTRQYEYIATRLEEAGRMVGGWRRAGA